MRTLLSLKSRPLPPLHVGAGSGETRVPDPTSLALWQPEQVPASLFSILSPTERDIKVPSILIAVIFEVFRSAFSGIPSCFSEFEKLLLWPLPLAKTVHFPFPRRSQNFQSIGYCIPRCR